MFKIFRQLFGARAQYMMICAQGEEKKAEATRLGMQSIILAVVGTVILVVMAVIGSLCAQNMMGTTVGDGQVSFPALSLLGAIVFYLFAFIGLMILLNGITFASLTLLALSIGAVIAILVVML